MQQQPEHEDRTGHSPPEKVVDDRVEQHAHEQRQRAEDEPKHEGPRDREIGNDVTGDPEGDTTSDDQGA